MKERTLRVLLFAVTLLAFLAFAQCAPAPAPTAARAVSSSTAATPPTTKSGTYLIGAGDIGWCGLPGADATARLINFLAPHSPGYSVLALGDLAYPDGGERAYETCFAPPWGQFKFITLPILGNHEYDVRGRPPYYFDYFGAAAIRNGRDGYYSMIFGSWLLLALNSEIPRSDAQLSFLRGELERYPRHRVAAMWHRPRWTSSRNGDFPPAQSLVDALYGRVELVLVAHDHVYERMYRLDSRGARDDRRGFRQITVGTGGAPLYEFRPANVRAAMSEFRYCSADGCGADGVVRDWGVARIRLFDGGYEWEYWALSDPENPRSEPRMVDSGIETGGIS